MRLLRSVGLLIGLALWSGGLLTPVSRWLYKTGVVADDYRFGDLYRFAPLPRFKQPQPHCPADRRASDTARTHLYIIGDSFTEPQRLSQADFRVSHYQRLAWDNPQRVQLDRTKRNVLLIESVERHVRERFPQPVTDVVIERDTAQTPQPQPSWWNRIAGNWHNADVEQRLEAVLFSHDWAWWFKERKAALTLNWFDRTDPNVSLSTDKQHIFLRSDTDPQKPLNESFSSLTDQEIGGIVAGLNATAGHFRRAGFDAVYVSIIPNKASILEPDRRSYNHLIERIQEHPKLRVPMVDTYAPFRTAPGSPYLPGDTHWNCRGRALWLRAVRQRLGI